MLGHFRRHGYSTAAIGKIHCPEYWAEDDSDLFHETCGCSIGGRSKEYARYLEERGLTDLEDHGAMQEFGGRGRQTVEGRPSKVSFEDGQEGWIANKATEFMGRCRDAERPFFVHVSLPKPHQCYTPAREFWDLYNEEELTLPPNADSSLEGKSPALRKTVEAQRTGDWTLFEPHGYEAGRLRKLHGYLGNVSHVDHAVGKLMKWIDQEGLGEDTIIIYSTDHGDFACEHGAMEKAPGICADAITRIPSIWRWPGRFRAGHVAEELVETVDVSATLTGLCGVPEMETSDGKDIGHLLEGRSGEVREVAVTEFAWSRSVRKGDWRLVWYAKEVFAGEYPDGFGELYNVREDPWEMTNLFFDPAHQEKVQELRADLLDWLVRTTRPKTVLGLPAGTADPIEGPGYGQRFVRYNCESNADGKIHPDRVAEVGTKNYR
jgi:choline-sulfatase/uncharacterized sulfatase